MTRLLLLPLAALAVALSVAPAHAQFVLYDDFESGAIDAEKWSSASNNGSFAGPAAEVRRQVDNGQLRLSLVSYGETGSDAGGVFSNQTLFIKQLGLPGGSGFITGIQARMTVLAAKAQPCGANPHPENTAPRVELAGRFFNDGSSTGPDDQTGDVQVFVIAVLDGYGNHRINAGLQHCTNPTCQGAVGIGGGQFATTWALNTPIDVTILWQEPAGKFKFTVNGESKSVFYPAGMVAAGPPLRDFKAVDVRNFVENCTAKRRKGFIDALIDNVAVRRQP